MTKPMNSYKDIAADKRVASVVRRPGHKAEVHLAEGYTSNGQVNCTAHSFKEARLFAERADRMITVTNLMSGVEVEIPESTPWCCNPASETYWSM